MANKDLIRRGNTSIEVYRSLDAAPEDWDAARFWLINELRRIQTGFFSVDEVLARLDADKGDGTTDSTVEGPVGPQGPAGPAGPQGPQGPAGADGNVGDLIADYQTALGTTWSSNKIQQELDSLIGGLDLGGSNLTVGGTPPVNPVNGDLFYDNVYTLELYVWDTNKWVSTTGGGGDGAVYVQTTQPRTSPTSPYLWIETGLGDGDDFTVWFNDPEH